ncbi:MAG: hypothetical protein ACLSTI_10810, partial [Ruminococcus sp.]
IEFAPQMWAARPHLASILKNCWIKKLLFACGSQLKAVQLDLLRKRGLLAHTSPAFLKNCCIEKLFRMIQRFP